MRSPSRGVEQLHRPAHQHAVHGMVDLREFGRPEVDPHVEFRAARSAGRRPRPDGTGMRCRGRAVEDRCIPRCARRNARSRSLVVGRERLEDRATRARRRLRRRPARPAAARRWIESCPSSSRSCGSSDGDALRHDRTARHVRNVAAALLVETDEHPAFLGNIPHGESRAMAIAPRRAAYRAQAFAPDALSRCATARPRARAA